MRYLSLSLSLSRALSLSSSYFSETIDNTPDSTQAQKKLDISGLKPHSRQATKTQFSTPHSRHKTRFDLVLYRFSELLEVQATVDRTPKPAVFNREWAQNGPKRHRI